MSIVKRNENLGMTNLFDDVFAKDLFNWGLDNHSRTATNLPTVTFAKMQKTF